ncbi:MAG: hypothetical protein QF362_01405 [Candidatus Woesearchaeota archaeon]|jgi:hypothetical protein|nr:hypothetical protein [Candidatus Woesearchaeota archaeon]MDP7506082.1 hypothetical protein [Candidatus Woesearchaeota archaeon]
MKKQLLLIVCFTILLSSSFTVKAEPEDIIIERIIQERVNYGDVLEVMIIATNNEAQPVNIKIEELITGEFEFIEPKEPKLRAWEGYNVSYLDWSVTIPANSKETIIYKIKPLLTKQYALSSTKAITENGNSFKSMPSSFRVFCVPDDICDTSKGENNVYCPEDCSTGIADNTCDYKEDGRCDPDCVPEADPDCEAKAAAQEAEEVQEEERKAPERSILIFIIPVIVVILIIAAIVYFMVSRKGKPTIKK